jgi:hypothetical protein
MKGKPGRRLAIIFASGLIYALVMTFFLRVLHWGFVLSFFASAVVGTVASTLLLHALGEDLDE